MTDSIHVMATFDSNEDLLDGMRRAVSWIVLDEPHALSALAGEERLKEVLCADGGDGPWYSEREVELAVQVWRDYPQALYEQRNPPAEAGGQTVTS